MPRNIARSKFFYLLLGAGIALAFLLGSFSLGRMSVNSNSTSSSTPIMVYPHSAFASTNQAGMSQFSSVPDIAERSLASVVNISSLRKVQAHQSPFFSDPFFREFFRHFGPMEPSPRQNRSLGSGVIVSADGIVLTNNHVIAEADKIKVTLSDKREVEAKVVGADPKSDIAVIKLLRVNNLRPIAIGDSERLRLGETVLAIGNPFGVGQTVTMGIVSAKGRSMGIIDYEDFIQTDAAINPGNSGGALINLRGELIGINTAILSRSGGYQGIGFAIPTNMAKPIMASLLKNGKVSRGWLGVAIQQVDEELAKALKLPTKNGVLISDVNPASPAAKAGLKRGDLVVKFNSQSVDSPGRLSNLVAMAGAKANVQLSYYRDGRLLTTNVNLADFPSTASAAQSQSENTDNDIKVVPLAPATRGRYHIPAEISYGVLVEAIKPYSSAALAGIQPGDVILEANRAKIDSVGRFHQILSSTKGRLLLLVYRRGSTLFMIWNRE